LHLQGGESLIGSGAAITARIPQHIKRRFAEKGGIKYTRIYPSEATIAAAASHTASNSSGQSSASNSSSSAAVSKPSSAAGVIQMSWQQRTGCSDKGAAADFFTRLGCTVEWSEAAGPHTLVA
jgi:hypothetical protein